MTPQQPHKPQDGPSSYIEMQCFSMGISELLGLLGLMGRALRAAPLPPRETAIWGTYGRLHRAFGVTHWIATGLCPRVVGRSCFVRPGHAPGGVMT
jgi:hypothetical protein